MLLIVGTGLGVPSDISVGPLDQRLRPEDVGDLVRRVVREHPSEA